MSSHCFLFLFFLVASHFKSYLGTLLFYIHNSMRTQTPETVRSLESRPCNLKSDSAVSNKGAHTQIENAKLHVSASVKNQTESPLMFAFFHYYIQR